MMANTEATDVAEDERFGTDGRDDDLEGEMARRESGLAKGPPGQSTLKPKLTPRPTTMKPWGPVDGVC